MSEGKIIDINRPTKKFPVIERNVTTAHVYDVSKIKHPIANVAVNAVETINKLLKERLDEKTYLAFYKADLVLTKFEGQIGREIAGETLSLCFITNRSAAARDYFKIPINKDALSTGNIADEVVEVITTHIRYEKSSDRVNGIPNTIKLLESIVSRLVLDFSVQLVNNLLAKLEQTNIAMQNDMASKTQAKVEPAKELSSEEANTIEGIVKEG